MSRKHNSPAAINVPITKDMERHIERHEGGKSVSALRNSGKSAGSSKESKALEPNPLRRFFTHALCWFIVLFPVVFTITKFKLGATTEPYACANRVTEIHSTATNPASFAESIDSSSYLDDSYASSLNSVLEEKCTLSPQNASLMSLVSSACACLTFTSTKHVEPDIVTVVSQSSRIDPTALVLLTLRYRPRRSMQRLWRRLLLAKRLQQS